MKKFNIVLAIFGLMILTSAKTSENESSYLKFRILHNGHEIRVNPMGLHGHLQHGDEFLGIITKQGKPK